MHLPLLSLEALRPRWSEPGRHAVIDRDFVLAASDLARADGVKAGLRRGGVLALSPETVLHARDVPREEAALEGVALCLLQYTPEVALAEEASVLLDVTASLRVFGGARALSRRVKASVLDLGFTPRVGVAPTAQGAWLLARHALRTPLRRGRRLLQMRTLEKRLDALPCLLLPAARAVDTWLEGIGCRTLGALRGLPRAGLQRRCGAGLLDSVDRAYGNAPELFDWFAAPPRFHARLELPDRVEHASALLFAARRLLAQLIGWLVAQQLAVRRLSLTLEHERGRQARAPTVLQVALAEATWQEVHLIRLLQEHLGRLGQLGLVAPVIGLQLDALEMTAMLPPTDSLFPEPGGTAADERRLLELLRARLGEDRVLVPAPRADHRPEVANGWRPLQQGAASLARGRGASCGESSACFAGEPMLEEMSVGAGLVRGERPFWLLDAPQKLAVRDHRPWYRSSLKLIGAAERIECGWWDGGVVLRDYFVAQDGEGVRYWIYRQREGVDVRWYLQGLFG